MNQNGQDRSPCKGCPYRDSYGGRTAGCGGDPTASLAVVGEAPGTDELGTGEPFTGASGKLLRKVLTASGLSADTSWFVTNSLRCRPPQGKPIKRAAFDSCLPRLEEELTRYPRRVILALGNSPLRALTGNHDLKITQERGRAIQYRTGAIIIPTVHPAYVLRSPHEYKRFADDVRYAVELMNGGKQKDGGKTQHVVIRDPERAREVVATLVAHGGKMACDIETAAMNPRVGEVLCVGVAWEKNKVVIFNLKGHKVKDCPAEDPRYCPHVNWDMVEALKPLFASKDCRFVWHNGKFDTQYLRTLGIPARVDDDTMLMHYTLDETRGTHDLKQLATVHYGAEDYDSIVRKAANCPPQIKKRRPHNCTQEHGYRYVPVKLMHPYCAEDCDYTYMLDDDLSEEQSVRRGLRELYTDYLLVMADFLGRVEMNGMLVDQARLSDLHTRLVSEKEDVEVELWNIVQPYWDPERYARETGAKKVPKEFNPGSTGQVTWLLYDQIKLRPRKKVKKLNTREETLLLLPQHPVVEGLLKFRNITKRLSTYVIGVSTKIDPRSGRVHTTYLLHGTVTGRLASRSPNVQNVPRLGPYRGIYGAPKGRILLEVDHNQAELRVLATLSRDTELARCYREGRSLHDEVGTQMYGDDFVRRYKQGEPLAVLQRIRAKAVNFGIAYGRTAPSLAHEFEIPVREASGLIDAWFDRFPTAHKYLMACRRAPLQGKVIVNPIGRRRRFPMVNRSNYEAVQNEACNFPISSTASDITLMGAIRSEPFVQEWDAKIINLVHDSVLLEVPDDQRIVDIVLNIMRKSMLDVAYEILGDFVPFEIDAKIGYHWGPDMVGYDIGKEYRTTPDPSAYLKID